MKALEFTYTIFDVPGATMTQPFGVNDNGVVVGAFTDAPLNLNHGFVRDPSGSFTTVDVPGATKGTTVHGITNDGVIVGDFVEAGLGHGYVRDATGDFMPFDAPDFINTSALGINDGDLTSV